MTSLGRNDICHCGSGLKFKRCCIEKVKFEPPQDNFTYWNWEKTPCAKVRVVVSTDIPSGWWCAGLEGTVRDAVRVDYGEQKFYLDNGPWEGSLGGDGWLKVTKGRGSPDVGHRSLPVANEVNAEECKHVRALPTFDLEAAKALKENCKHPPNPDPIDGPFGICGDCNREIRKRWPRFDGECPDCGKHLIAYASSEHYIFGDW